MGVRAVFAEPDRRFVERWVWASVVANAVIVLTGGLVRLTGSGLGCPTWPRCTDESFVPHSSLGVYGVIEFSNRLLTYVLIAVAVATLVAVWRWSQSTRAMRVLAVLMAAGIPFQGIIGGITVLTDLNPWIVSLHLILSLVLIMLSVRLLTWVRTAPHDPAPATARWLSWLTFALMWVVVYLGTVVTGSGPHAGDADSPRNGLDPELWSHLHGDSVVALIALTVATWFVLRRTAPRAAKVAAVVIGIELAQGLIGIVQYLTDLPIALVAAHLVGASVMVAAGTWLLLTVHAGSRSPSDSVAVGR